MSQHDYDIANQTFPNTRADINNALEAIATNNSGATAPSTTYVYQLWYDTGNDTLKIRNADNDAWINLFKFDQTAGTGSLTGDPRYGLRNVTYLTTGSAQTYTVPDGVKRLRVRMVGGGGGGGGALGDNDGRAEAAGGGAGGFVEKWIESPAASYTYTVGGGGAGAGTDATGTDGGDTTFTDGASLTLTSGGGGGGEGMNDTASSQRVAGGGAGGTATGGDINAIGNSATDAVVEEISSTVYRIESSTSGASVFGGARKRRLAAAGDDGGAPGAGGGSSGLVNTTTDYAGGDGADGIIIIEEFG